MNLCDGVERAISLRKTIYDIVTKVYSAHRAESDAFLRVAEHPAAAEILTRLLEASVASVAETPGARRHALTGRRPMK
jgi:hypothetical protein